MTERRRFNQRERTALYLAADGKCSQCGAELEPGWHADHMTPHSKHGKTDVINGQALCPTCNIEKGDRMTDLRPWQEDALIAFNKSNDDFLVVAAPGTGKTRFSLVAAKQSLEVGNAHRVVVVVPTSHLRRQWSGAATEFGIQLDHRFTNGAGAMAKDFDGVVVTYSAVASSPLLFRKLTSQVPTLVILDEIHHGGDSLSWGESLKSAFDFAHRRLLLSGTPTRTDRNPVPFVHYDASGRFVADKGRGYTYDYGTAVQDHAVRPIEFLALDGSVRWREAGSVVSTELKDADDDTLANALKTALDPDGEWIESVLRRADAELTRHRTDVSDAAGLVVAADMVTARKYKALLSKIAGEQPTVATSDDPDASDRIAEFSDGTTRWLIAVQMVSEGVDIPRLAVGVYASRFRTDLFFRQVVGRFVRMRTLEDGTTATLLVPSIEPLLSYAKEIERMVGEALRQEERQVREQKENDAQLALRFDLVEPLDSSEAAHHSTIRSGESFSDEELQRAQSLLESRIDTPSSATPAWLAGILRMAGAGKVVGTATIDAPASDPSTRPLADQKVSLRRLVNKKVGRLNNMTDKPHSHIHSALNRHCDDTAKTATAETLQRRLDILDRWISDITEVGSTEI